MGTNVREFIDILIAVARRRWLLIALPIALFIGLSVLAASFWPRTYVARTLVMLQEGQANDPLNQDSRSLRQTQLRGAALDTLLKSERVLRGAIQDYNLGNKPFTAKEFEQEIKSLRRQIFVGVVGQEFIEIELRQSDPDGLADRLSIIVTRFLERLFSREDSMKTARQFALERRKQDLEFAEQTLTEWLVRNQNLVANSPIKSDILRIAELRKTRSEAEKKLVDAAGTVIQGPVELTNIVATLAQARQFPLSNASAGTQNSVQMQKLEALFENYEAVSKAVVEGLRRTVALTENYLKPSQMANGTAHQDLRRIVASYTEAVDQYTVHRAQTNKSKGRSQPPFGLINPELIRIIDEPKDPVSPSTSILKIIVACLAAGIGLGAGLAALAEQVDDTLYDAGELGRLSGINLVIKVPGMDAKSIELDRPPTPMPS